MTATENLNHAVGRPNRMGRGSAPPSRARKARAEWKVSGAERETSPNEVVEHWKTVVENETSGERATLHSAVFNGRVATLRVIDQPDAPRNESGRSDGARKSRCGVNGGYFDPEDLPVGLLISDGRDLAPLRKAKLLSGVLTASASGIDVVRVSRFAMEPKNQIRRPVRTAPGRTIHSDCGLE